MDLGPGFFSQTGWSCLSGFNNTAFNDWTPFQIFNSDSIKGLNVVVVVSYVIQIQIRVWTQAFNMGIFIIFYVINRNVRCFLECWSPGECVEHGLEGTNGVQVYIGYRWKITVQYCVANSSAAVLLIIYY